MLCAAYYIYCNLQTNKIGIDFVVPTLKWYVILITRPIRKGRHNNYVVCTIFLPKPTPVWLQYIYNQIRAAPIWVDVPVCPPASAARVHTLEHAAPTNVSILFVLNFN